jgi:hypothetical protein
MRQFGKPKRRWEYNIHKALTERGCGSLTAFIWLRIGEIFENGNEHSVFLKCGDFLDYL